MKKLAGLFVLMLLGFGVSNVKAAAAPNVFLDVQVSSSALPGAQVKGFITSSGVQSRVVNGRTNAFGQVSLGFNIVTSSIPQGANFLLKGQGTNGIGFIQGSTSGSFTLTGSSIPIRVPVLLFLQ